MIALTAALALLAACPRLAHAAEKDDKKTPSVMYSSYSVPIRSLDPATGGDTMSSALQGMVFEGLYQYHFLKRPVEVIPQLAAAMPHVSVDGLVWTIKIKKGVKYTPNACFGKGADGKLRTRTVRAADFIFAFKRLADEHMRIDYRLLTSMGRAFIEDKIVGFDAYIERTKQYKAADLSRFDLPIAGLKALDDLTLQIRLTKPFPRLAHILAMQPYAPIPPEAIKHCWLKTGGLVLTRPDLHVSTGPYVIKEFTPKSRIVFVRNPNFRPEVYPSEGAPADKAAGLLEDAGRRLPFIDRIEWDYLQYGAGPWGAFLAGQVDTSYIPPKILPKNVGPDMKLTSDNDDHGIVLARNDYPSVYWMCFNMDDPVVGKSKALRQAMCLAFDVESYLKLLFNNRGRRAVNCVPFTFPGHAQAGPGPYAKFDLDLARKKLIDARKELLVAGVIEPGADIPTIKIEFGARDVETVKRARFIQEQFAAIGLKVALVLNDWPTLQRKVTAGKAQMFLMGWSADYGDVENFLQLYYSPNIKTGTNSTHYSNPEFDKLYAQLQAMPDGPKRTAICTRAIRLISEDCPILLLTEPTSYTLHHKWLRNYKPHPIGYGMVKYYRIDAASRPKRTPIKKPKPPARPGIAPPVDDDF